MEFTKDASVVPKLCGILIFSITSLVIGLLPLAIHSHFKRRQSNINGRKAIYKRLLAHMSAFGGGVLLSTTFLHLLPEIRKSIEVMKQKKLFSFKESVQLPELLMCLGFLFLYFIEEVAHTIMSEKPLRCVKRLATNPTSQLSNHDQETTVDAIEISEKRSTAESMLCENIGEMNVPHHHGDRLPCHNESMIFFTESAGRSFLLIFALSIHEGFEGLAIGLERQVDAVWYMVLGVGSHKAVIAFCIGVQMLSSKLNRKVSIIYVLMFATATSFGVAFGMFLSMESGLFSVVLQGLATGTLVHVVFFELLKPHSENTPFMGVFLGFVSMAVLKYFSP